VSVFVTSANTGTLGAVVSGVDSVVTVVVTGDDSFAGSAPSYTDTWYSYAVSGLSPSSRKLVVPAGTLPTSSATSVDDASFLRIR
jgi:hypothetical protein